MVFEHECKSPSALFPCCKPTVSSFQCCPPPHLPQTIPWTLDSTPYMSHKILLERQRRHRHIGTVLGPIHQKDPHQGIIYLTLITTMQAVLKCFIFTVLSGKEYFEDLEKKSNMLSIESRSTNIIKLCWTVGVLPWSDSPQNWFVRCHSIKTTFCLYYKSLAILAAVSWWRSSYVEEGLMTYIQVLRTSNSWAC